jgi:urease accessory protein
MKTAAPQASLPLAAILLLLPVTPALAHTVVGTSDGFTSGFLHPITGLDHLVAMVAVGLWGAQLGNPAIWVLPIAFPLVMAIGGFLGVAGLDLPLTEPIVALSGIALGLLIALHVRLPLWVATILVGVFAIFHGYAHGRELPDAMNPAAYGVGFVTATGLLHLSGIVIGLLVSWPVGATAVRACGAAIGCIGAYFLLAAFGVVQ